MIVCITGGPRTGKTHLAEAMALTSGTTLLRTDDLIALGWSQASQAVAARMLTTTGDLIVEGVAVPRALRKALDQTDGRPCDRLIVLRSVRPEAGARSPGQVAMDKGLWRVLRDVWTELVARGVEIVGRDGEPMEAP